MAPPLAFHLVFRLQDDRVFAPSPAARRSLARTLVRLSRAFKVLAWRVVDTHMHVLGLLTEAQVAELARRLRIAIARMHPGLPLLLSRKIPVANQWHLGEVFGYVLRQDAHHGVGSDPFQEGSCLLDLLAMRTLGAEVAFRVSEHLPRVTREHLLKHLDVPALEEYVHLEHLAASTCAAFALPDLARHDPESVAARCAAVHAAHGQPVTRIAEALGISPRAVRRIAERPAARLDVRAVRLQMALRATRTGVGKTSRSLPTPVPDSGPEWGGTSRSPGSPVRN